MEILEVCILTEAGRARVLYVEATHHNGSTMEQETHADLYLQFQVPMKAK